MMLKTWGLTMVLLAGGAGMAQIVNDRPETLVRQVLKQPRPAGWRPTGLSKAYYVDLIERIVRNAALWVDARGAVIDPVIRQEWGQTTSRFAVSGAIALHFGRCQDLKETIFRSMDYACHELSHCPDIKKRSPDFWMRELAVAWKVLKTFAPADRYERWRQDLAAVVPQKHYLQVAETAERRRKINNWCIFGASGESLRESFGIGGRSGILWGNAFFDVYLKDQLHHFSEYGMYRDPNDPITYDVTTRLQIATALHGGYRGQFAALLDDFNRRANFVLLLMLAPTGEVPFGGRSSQFQFQEAIAAAHCELEAVRYKTSDPVLAGAFKRQAHLSALAVRDGILRDDGQLFHIKNRFPQETRHGCDPYGHYSVYSLLAGSLFGLAAIFADDTIPEAPCPAELGGFGFDLTGSFEKAFANCAGNYLEFDLLANLKEDAAGLGRIILAGVPFGILPAAPCAPDPHYIIDPKLKVDPVAAAVAPEWLDKTGKLQRLAEKGTDKKRKPGVFRVIDGKKGIFEAEYRHKGATTLYHVDIGTPGKLVLSVTLKGPCQNPVLIFPLLEFDGEKEIDYRKFVRFSLTPQKGGCAANRNGRCRLYRFPIAGKSITLTVEAIPPKGGTK